MSTEPAERLRKFLRLLLQSKKLEPKDLGEQGRSVERFIKGETGMPWSGTRLEIQDKLRINRVTFDLVLDDDLETAAAMNEDDRAVQDVVKAMTPRPTTTGRNRRAQ